MGDNDYSTVAMIAGERPDIGITASSTPTGKRGIFYQICTDPSLGYSHHHHPSTENPNWSQEMEDQFRAELTPTQYEHEILAEFGSEDAGVFNKQKVDLAITQQWYAYDTLDSNQLRNIEGKPAPEMLLYDRINRAPANPFRCMGVDFDAYQAGSSLLVLDYDVNVNKFKVIRRVEVPKGEYTLDHAVNCIIELNEIYNPSWIFCDRGYGELNYRRLMM